MKVYLESGEAIKLEKPAFNLLGRLHNCQNCLMQRAPAFVPRMSPIPRPVVSEMV